MALEIFKLVGSIMVDNKAANDSIGKTDEKAQGVGSTLANGIKTAGKWALGLGAAAATVGAAMYKTATNAAKNADEIDKMSQRLGVSRQAYQELDFALSQSGVDINSFQTGMKSLLKNMDAVSEGNKTAISNFEMLGVSAVDSSGKMRRQEEVLWETISAFQGMSDSAEKSRLAQELFGKQGQEILPLLNAESGSIEEMKQKAHDLGIVLGDETIDAGVKFTDTVDQVKRSGEAIMTQIGADVTPVIVSVFDWVIAHMPEIKATVGEVVGAISEVIKALMPVIKNVFQIAGQLWNTTLKPVLTGILTFITGVFTGDWKKAWDGVKKIFSGIWDGIKYAFKIPINWIIDGINTFIRGLNRLKIPSWVPVVGGLGFSMNTIPHLASGGVLEKGQTGFLEGNGAEAVVPLENNRKWIHAVAEDMRYAGIGSDDKVVGMLANILNALEDMAKAGIYLDEGRLVGALAGPLDKRLGMIAAQKART